MEISFIPIVVLGYSNNRRDRVGLIGISSHSFRCTALTQMSNAGIPLRIIQEISGHRNLSQLQRYLEVKPSQVRGAIARYG